MIIIHKERTFIDKYRCIDRVVKTRVDKFAFTQGDLLYYKKDRFNYLIIAKNELIHEILDDTKKYYNFETAFISLRDELRTYLHNNDIYYELSGGNGFYHFEILADAVDAAVINNFIDSVSITEVR